VTASTAQRGDAADARVLTKASGPPRVAAVSEIYPSFYPFHHPPSLPPA
jgi:hypothetical protein